MQATQKADAFQKAGFLGLNKNKFSDGDVVEDDFMPRLMATFEWSLVAARLRRGLRLTSGWPCRLLCGDAGDIETFLADLKEDLAMYASLKEAGNLSVVAKQVLQWHEFHKVALQQTLAACKELNFQRHGDLGDV